MAYYPALIRKEPASDVGVEFPDFPGCVTAAPTLDEALSLAGEALRFHVDGIVEDGEAIPDPTLLETVLESSDAQGAAAFLVRLSPPKGRAIRVNITLDENLLAEIDAAARDQGTTRSGFLAMSARWAVDPFVAKLYEATRATGSVFKGLQRIIAQEEKTGMTKPDPSGRT
jgi:predicted RNase H-like HicB family nuclease